VVERSDTTGNKRHEYSILKGSQHNAAVILSGSTIADGVISGGGATLTG